MGRVPTGDCYLTSQRFATYDNNMRRRPSPKLRQIINRFANIQSNDELEAFKERVASYWKEQGYNPDIIQMAFKYAHERAEAATRPITEDIKAKIYPLYFASEIERADNWLHSLRKMLESSL